MPEPLTDPTAARVEGASTAFDDSSVGGSVGAGDTPGSDTMAPAAPADGGTGTPLQLAREVYDIHAEDLDALAAAATALSRWLVAPPTADVLAAVRDPELLAQWPLPAQGATAAGLELLQRSGTAVGEARAESGETADDVRADHMQLFVGPGRVSASPYESVHRSRDRLLFDEQTLHVRQWYRHFGVSAPREGREPDDHIGLELEFTASLVSRALEMLADGDDIDAAGFVTAAAGFVDEHLARWAPDLADLVLAHAHTDFYRGVAQLLRGLLTDAASILPPAQPPSEPSPLVPPDQPSVEPFGRPVGGQPGVASPPAEPPVAR